MINSPIPLDNVEIKNDNKGNILVVLKNAIIKHDPTVYFVITEGEHDNWLGGNPLKSIVTNNKTVIKIHREIVRFLGIGTVLKIVSVWIGKEGDSTKLYLFMKKRGHVVW